jgi:WD40 repeat protein
LALSPDGKKAVTLHNGVITLIDIANMNSLSVPSYDKKIPSPLHNGSFLGVAFSADSKTLYLSGGDNGAVIIYDAEKFIKTDSISLNGKIGNKSYEDSFTSDLLFNIDKNELLVLDRGNFRMIRIDLATKN